MSERYIDNIATTYGTNKGGIKYFEFVPKEWLQAQWYVDTDTNIVSPKPALQAGKAWKKTDSKFETASYTEEPKTDKRGDYFLATAKGRLLLDHQPLNKTLTAMMRHEYVLIIYDYNGNMRIAGNKDKGFSFMPSYDSTQQIQQGTEYNIIFQNEIEKPAPFLSLGA